MPAEPNGAGYGCREASEVMAGEDSREAARRRCGAVELSLFVCSSVLTCGEAEQRRWAAG